MVADSASGRTHADFLAQHFVQLAVDRGARVIGTASAANHDYLRQLGVVAVEYGPGQLERIQQNYQRQFSAMDSIVGQYTSLGSYLQQQFEALAASAKS